ncbi:pirin family protein [Chitinophaga rhizophila]|uniref:Pirin family protein n=1 Tax=Chitinophaga rhizophila TaxID=2866212 RepID=A0ABS7GDJ4_9BACT|nr:pirin family protein [Chitinophaga rhizophila]MBW8685749.1 pirin family protein [Chitinophaga rhizophila]
MEKIIHRADSRSFSNHGWLQSYHTFSFAGYYNPERIHFGALRVLNDDIVKGGMGFGTHPHDNMEIVSIPLTGALEHKDNTGRHEIIRNNEVQIMSAGSGIAHSEFNASKTDPVNFLQIWVFPKLKNITPRYQQQAFDIADRHNKLQVVVSPEADSNALLINQDAWFSLGHFDEGQSVEIAPKMQHHGTYLFVLDGEVEIAGETLKRRDAIGLSNYESATIRTLKAADFLLIDVPMI